MMTRSYSSIWSSVCEILGMGSTLGFTREQQILTAAAA